jgi:microcystin-dependent protein
MPSDANGVYSLPSGSTAVTGETIQASTHNTPIEDISLAISQRLMRSGVAPMTGPLKIVDGAVGSPAVKFSTDGTTGFYKTTNGIGVSVGGAKVAEFTSSGLSLKIGMMIPWVLLSAPSGWVLPYGQTLSRTTYADLWTIAQDEISNGNTFFNNGDGSTTFGIGDMRGRVPAGKDDMGGTSASRLSNVISGGSVTLGNVGGEQTHTIARSELPNVAPTFTGTQGTVNVTSTDGAAFISQPIGISVSTGGSASAGTGFSIVHSSGNFTPSGTVSSINGNVSQTAMNVTQPSMICNYILYAGA